MKLDNLCSKIGSGKTPKGGENVYLKEGIPFIRSQNVANNILTLDETHISEATHQSMKGSKVLANDILLNITGASIGRSCVVPIDFEEGNVNQHVAIIRLKNYDSNFLQFILSSSIGQKLIFQSQTGSGREGLNFDSIKKFKIYFPSIQEQKKISSFLALLNDRIQTQNKIIHHLESLIKGFSQKIFSQQLRFKDDTGNDFPEWDEKELDKIGKTINGLTGKTKEDFGKGKPYIQYKQIFDSSRINIKDCGLVDIKESENQVKVKYGDVFFTTSSETPNEIGTSSVLLNDVEEMYLNSFCFGFRVNPYLLNPLFSRFLFRSESFRKKIIPLAQGSTRYNISKSSFLKLKIIIPSLEEQTKIANFLSSLDAKLDKEKQLLEQYQQQKKFFLQNLFV